MGPLLAIFLTIALNLVPDGTPAVTISSFVLEGVGMTSTATDFLATRSEDDGWLIHDAFGEAWFQVAVEGGTITITNPANGVADTLDLTAAFGLADAWWRADVVAPTNAPPLPLTAQPNGLDVALEGQLAARIRW